MVRCSALGVVIVVDAGHVAACMTEKLCRSARVGASLILEMVEKQISRRGDVDVIALRHVASSLTARGVTRLIRRRRRRR